MPLTDAEETWTSVAAGTSSGLSLIGALYILGRYWYARRKKAKTLVVSSLHNLEITKELIHVLAWLDLVGAFGRIFGTYPAQTYNQSKGEPVSDICNVQAFVITFGDSSLVAWNLTMAFNLFRWICVGEDQESLLKKIKWYILATSMFGLALPIIALSFHKFGNSGNWCWISVPGKRAEEYYWKVGILYVWVVLGASAMITFLVRVKVDMKKRLQSYENEDAKAAYNGVVHNLTIYISAFIVCWIPGIVNRAYSAITGRDSFTLSMFHSSIVPLQGFVNAVIYGKFHRWVGRMVTYGGSSTSPKQTSSHDSKLKKLANGVNKRDHMGIASIFITSFDMNWNEFPSNLEDWIPPKKDLYVFSLQHCLRIQHVEQSIRKYLLRVNYPTAYRSITSLAGSAFRGQHQNASVCQIIFVNNADDASGNFQFYADDGRKWAQRKTFKEVAGIPVRYFDASLAFVSCNLSSSRRANDVTNDVSAKHAVTTRLIHSFGMDADNAAIDFPNLYHHTFLSGNLNYDVDMRKAVLATSLDQAYKAESLKRATDSAIESKLKTLRESKALAGDSEGAIHSSTCSYAIKRDNPMECNSSDSKQLHSSDRNSNVSTSADDDLVYREVYTSCCDDLPFTILESPLGPCHESSRTDLGQLHIPENEEFSDDQGGGTGSVGINVINNCKQSHRNKESNGRRLWGLFMDSLFVSQRSSQDTAQQTSSFSTRQPGVNGRGATFRSSVRADSKKICDLLVRSQAVAENTAKKWKELLRYDELRVGMEAKEVLCGFEEPPIQFLPSYPRQIGSAASFAIVAERSYKDLFAEMSLDPSKSSSAPAYKDRILIHSLQDTKQRIRNTGYWLCEEIVTSSHKPVCSLYELEIDRFFSFEMIEPAVFDTKDALRDKTGVREFRITLANLDANVWMYEAQQSASFAQQSSRSYIIGGNPVGYESSTSSSAGSLASSFATKKTRSISTFVDRVFGKDRSESTTSTKPATPYPFSNLGSDANLSHRLTIEAGDGLAGLSPHHVDLVPVKPLTISTVFPLPSEDVYALQRKVYEVAHFVQNGFQSSAVDDEIEETQLAYTNFRTVPWKDASRHGVVHSAVTKPVNGCVHIAITIKAEHGHGGQGVLCIQEEDILKHGAPVVGEARPIPFDVTLTWGGKHVGYLHGDIFASVY